MADTIMRRVTVPRSLLCCMCHEATQRAVYHDGNGRTTGLCNACLALLRAMPASHLDELTGV